MAGQRWQWRQTIERSDVRGVWRIRVEARLLSGASEDRWIATVHGARAMTSRVLVVTIRSGTRLTGARREPAVFFDI